MDCWVSHTNSERLKFEVCDSTIIQLEISQAKERGTIQGYARIYLFFLVLTLASKILDASWLSDLVKGYL